MVKKEKGVKGYISLSTEEKAKSIRESFKGQVVEQEIKFPKELGVSHPFNFKDMEKSFKKIGMVNGIVNKLKNSIVGDFSVKVDNENIQAFLDDFIHNTNFKSVLSEWIKEGVLKGNGFMELDFTENKVRVLNANDMYVKRDNKGKVKEYNQWSGKKFFNKKNTKEVVPFKPAEIAHLKTNKISNEAYGLGYIYANERTIINQVKMEQALEKIMERKSGMPIHVKIGEKGQSVQKADIDSMSALLQFMHEKTEWVTDGNVEMNLIDFKGIEQSSIAALEHNRENIATGTNIPVVLLGAGNIPEGLAKAQSEDSQRFIKSVQQEIESIVEEQIFKPLILNQKFPDTKAEGVDDKAIGGSNRVKFVWNLPGEEEINKRIEKVTALLANFNITENMKRMLQIELAKLLNLEDAEKFLMEPEAGIDEVEKKKEDEFRDASLDTAKNPEKPKASNSPEAKKEKKIKQPEVPGAKPNAKAKFDGTGEILHKAKICNKQHMHGEGCGQQLTESESAMMTIKEFVSLQEIDGFNYSDYLLRILRRLRVDKFEQLAGFTEQQIADGLLNQREVNKLRIILKDGFRKNRTMAEIQKEIDSNINLKDRLNEGKVTATAESRPQMIARTETVRIANQGLLDTYKDNGIKQVRFLAALSERTCPQCEALNGQVFELKESQGIIPVHTMCRCTWLSAL